MPQLISDSFSTFAEWEPFQLYHSEIFKQKAVQWASRFSRFCWMDGNGYQYPGGAFPDLLLVGCAGELKGANNFFWRFFEFQSHSQKWIYGHLNYDLKNQLENLKSENPDRVGFPEATFSVPEVILRFEKGTVLIHADQPALVFKEISEEPLKAKLIFKGEISAGMPMDYYLQAVENIRAHILEGDVYELNFCQEFFANDSYFEPVEAYFRLQEISPNPFSCLYKLGNNWMVGASPERFMKKVGRQLISQPIKGTIERGIDAATDLRNKALLYQNEKERAENLMIVDLVRNDLAKSAEIGSVEVSELFGIYTFPQVHQMISTVKAFLKSGVSVSQALANAFPMGSMTGAPKVKSMQLIEQYEISKRGLFSGTVGVISPEGNFDFNVNIRSLFWNQQSATLSWQVGSAITYDSDPFLEYKECLTKAAAIEQLLAY